MTGKDRLSIRTKIGYGVGDLGANLVFTTVNFYLMYFLTDISLLEASLAGVSMMAVRLIDAFADPLIGYCSDRTSTRWGRRRPYILFGSFLVGISFFLLFTRVEAASTAARFAYFTAMYLIFFIAYSLVNVPYSALTPDMTQDFNERTNLVGFRMAAAVIGSLIAAGATKALVGLFPDEVSGFQSVAGIYGIVFIAMSLIVFLSVRERTVETVSRAGDSPVRLYLAAFKNRPFLIVALTYILHTMAVVVISATTIYYFKYYIQREDHIGTIFLTLLGTAIVFIPFWVTVSKKIGKKLSYNSGMIVFALAILVLFFMGPERLGIMYAITALAGAGFSTFFTLPWAIVPDTIEYHESQTGRRDEGIFYGIWSFGPKVGSALASLFIGVALSFAGYIPNAALQSESALLGIRITLSVVPSAVIVAGIAIMSFYPITQELYEEIVRGLEKERR